MRRLPARRFSVVFNCKWHFQATCSGEEESKNQEYGWSRTRHLKLFSSKFESAPSRIWSYLEAKQQDLIVLHVENLVVGAYLAAPWLGRFLLLVRLCHLDISGPPAWRQGLDWSEGLVRTCGVGLQTPEERQKWVVGDRLILVWHHGHQVRRGPGLSWTWHSLLATEVYNAPIYKSMWRLYISAASLARDHVYLTSKADRHSFDSEWWKFYNLETSDIDVVSCKLTNGKVISWIF